MKKLSSYQLTATAVMSTLILISTSIRIPIPIGSSTSMIHLGNVFCIMSSLLLGPFLGGLSCATGTLLFDILNPAYITSAPFTIIFKFLMGFACGLIAYSCKKNAESVYLNTVAAIVGLLIYISLRLTKSFILYRYILNIELTTCILFITKSATVSIINGGIAVILAVPLSLLLKRALYKNGIILYSKK